MKRMMLLALSASVVAACGGMDETDGTTTTKVGALYNLWSASVSEEQPAGVTCGTDPAVATRIWCTGSYCDNMRIWCGALPAGMTKTSTGTYWSPYISEETGFAQCPVSQVIDGIRATGSFSDNISIHCSPVTLAPQGYNEKWSPWISEEQGVYVFNVDPQNRLPTVASVVRCSGSFCDNMSFWISQPKCTSNADCFDACVNGWCTVH